MNAAETADQRLRASIRYITGKSIPAVSKLMGMMLLVYAAIFLTYFTTSGTASDQKWTVFVGTLIIIVCSTLILLDFSFNLNRTIGLYAIAIGGNRAFKFCNYLVTNGSNEMMTAVYFIFGLVMIGVSANLCYTGYIFLRGETRGRVSMTFSSSFMLIVTIAMLIIISQSYNIPFVDVLSAYPEYTVMIVLYLVLICMLGTESIRKSDKAEHYVSVLNGIRKIDASSDNAFIYRGAANILCDAFADRSSWTKIQGDGPVDEEYKFILHNNVDDESYVTVQKWKGEDDIYFTISDHEDGSLFNAYRFACSKIVPEGSDGNYDRLVLFGKDAQMQILIRDEPVKKKWGLHVRY